MQIGAITFFKAMIQAYHVSLDSRTLHGAISVPASVSILHTIPVDL
jgi:hypothetical protein